MKQTTSLIGFDGVHVFNDLRVYVNATYPDMESTRSWNLYPCGDGGLLVTGCTADNAAAFPAEAGGCADIRLLNNDTDRAKKERVKAR